jgi:hypothetical protein
VKNRAALTLLLLVGICVGCSDGKPEIVPVSGQVLLDGKPLTFGFIRFAPTEGGRLSMGRIDENGHFRLTCYESGDGAIVGTHRIAVFAHEVVGQNKIRWIVPRRYSDYSTSGLTQVISAPTDSLVIRLTTGESHANSG